MLARTRTVIARAAVTITPAAGTTPRRLGVIAGGIAVTGALLATLTGFAGASAATRTAASATQGATVREQQALSQNVSVATNNVHTILSSSPVLPEGNYQVNSAVSFTNLPAGSVVLCGWTTSDPGDGLYANYGDVENQGATAGDGNCAVTGIAKINNLNDHLMLWATVFSGPAGPAATSWSMNETRIGKAVISSRT
jgi:hypothetical protein